MEVENSTLDVPEWIDNNFVSKILNLDDTGEKLKSWKIERATAPGDNYGSFIYRLTVDLICGDKIQNKCFIVKVELRNAELSKFTSEANVFYREIQAYSTVIPQMNKMLQEIFSDKFQPFAPQCYYTHLGPPGSVLVFEDLKKDRFKLAERTLGLDMRHSLLVVRRLAVYHASSVVLYQKQPELFEPFKKSIFGKSNTESLRGLNAYIFRSLAELVEEWPGYKERFSEKLRKIADNVVEIIVEEMTIDEDDFNVLAHVDPWINNIMFQYSEGTGEVADFRLVDFQACQWLAPAVDIQRYLLSTATAEVVEQQEFILEEYLKVLRNTLDALGYLHLCPTIQHLKEQMKRRAMYGFILGMVVRAFFLADPDDFPDVNKIMRNEAKLKYSEVFKEVVRKLLPVLEKNNWI